MTKVPSRRARRAGEAPPRKGDMREAAILGSLETLLERAPLSAISIDDIAKGAGISRPGLYFYFASRSEAFATLLRRTLEEFTGPNREELTAADRSPELALSGILKHVLQSWKQHGTVLRRAVEALDDPVIQQLWHEAVSINVGLLAEWIERSRARGTAIDTGIAPIDLAEALAWMVERGYYQLFRHEHSEADEKRKVAAFASIMLRAAGFPDRTAL